MSLPIDELVNPISAKEVERVLCDTAKGLGLPVTAWQEGSVALTMIRLVALVVSGALGIFYLLARAGFLDWAEGVWLTLLARYGYGVERRTATYAATETYTLVNAGGGLYDVGIGDLTLLNPATKKQYKNVAAFVLNPLSTLDAALEAVEPGSGSSAAAATITSFVTPLAGVTGSNPDTLVGLDEELDADLRQRCRDKLGSLSPDGPAQAYAFAARTASLVGDVVVTRVKVETETSTGTVTVTLAGPAGALSGGDVTLVDTGLRRWALPEGITLVTQSATNHPLAVTSEVWVYTAANLTSPEIEVLVAAALTAYIPTVRIGGDEATPGDGKVWRDTAREKIGAAVTGCFHVLVSVPAADVDLTAYEVATLGVVTTTVNLVSGP